MEEQAEAHRKYYSPDIVPYSLEGRSGVFGTLSSIAVAPIRLVSRVMHNIQILPAPLLKDYAESLLLVGGALLIIGIIDWFVFNKWPLMVSQVPVLILAFVFRSRAIASAAQAEEKREVDINVEQVESLCSEIYGELDKIMEETK